MSSNKNNAQRRAWYKLRKKLQRAGAHAAVRAEKDELPPSPPNDSSAPSEQRKDSNPRPEIKTIDITQRVKLTEKVLCVMQANFTATFRSEAAFLRTAIAELTHETLSLRADMCKLKNELFRELVQQKAINQKLEEAISKLEAKISGTDFRT